MVLVLTNRHDLTADLVVREITSRGAELVRFDTADFPSSAVLEGEFDPDRGWTGTLRVGERTLVLEEVTSIWYRRPKFFTFDDRLNTLERKHAFAESRQGLGGVLRSLPALWVNHPDHMTFANYKPFQLEAARRCGLQVPRTIITNSAGHARDFAGRQSGPIVFKSMSNGPTGGGAAATLYTSQVDVDDLDDAAGIECSAYLFQERLAKHRDVRVTVVGAEIFAASIEGPALDWRTLPDRELKYEIHELSPATEAAVRRFVSDLHLPYAAIDFVLTEEGTEVFLEVNTAGEWGWIEHHTGLPITRALVDLLMRAPRPARALTTAD
jgi:ATP-grasp ribosomal peptide maturase